MNANQTAVAKAVAEAFPATTSDDDNLPSPHDPQKDQDYAVFDDDILVVMVKYTVKKLEDIPNGVKLKATGNKDAKHAQDAIDLGKEHLAEKNRHRPGRGDTGEPVLHVSSCKQSVLACMRSSGYQLVDLHYFYNTAKSNYVIQLVLSRQVAKGDGLVFASLRESEAEAIRSLEASAWEVWVYDNRNVGKPTTINFTGRHEERVCKNPASSTKKLRIKDGVMRAYDE